mgnify:CR=1 FL=1
MIFEAIAVGKVALEALQTVKGLLEEGKGIAEAGRDLGKFFDAKEEVQKKIDSGRADDADFWEMEKIKQAEHQFFEQLAWYGRPGLKDDYLRWQKTRKELREKAEKREKAKRLAKKKAIKNGLIYTAAILAGCLVVGLGIWLLLAIIAAKGR